MKIKFILLLGISLLYCQSILAVSASIDYAVYQDVSSDKFYIEVYTHIVGQSVVFTNQENSGNYQSSLQSTILIKDGEKIVTFKKYNLASPLSKVKIDFSDVARMYMEEGKYTLSVEIIDNNQVENKFDYTTSFMVDKVALSTLRLLSSINETTDIKAISKNGFDMEALAYNRYFDKLNKLISYVEIYPDLTQEYSYLQYKILQDDNIIKEKVKRVKNMDVTPCLLVFDITDLPSNNYQFVVNLVKKDKSLINSQTVDFSRSNIQKDMELDLAKDDQYEDSFVHNLKDNKLDYNLKAIIPIATQLERKIITNALDNDSFKIKRYALHEYWMRNSGGANVEAYFDAYMQVAKAVDQKYYSGFGYGFESDRGHIFLKYGKPTNTVSEINEPTAPPYEIWVYGYLEQTKEHNVKFVFYSPSLSDDYLLLHSTCQYELSNANWEHVLYKNAPKDLEGNSIDGGTVKENWNRKAKFYFDNI